MSMTEFLALLNESDLSPREIEVRERFVEEYFKDFSPKRAAIRTGYPDSIAGEIGIQMMNDKYVLTKISIKEREAAANPKREMMEQRRQVILGLLKESQNYGVGSSHSARVSALSKLSHLLDMEPASKIDVRSDRGGVMQVPTIQDADTWEEAALASQQGLTSHAVN